jgi:signal transduction histidine kinase
LPENKEIMVYRVVQELVNNSLKHSEAKTIRLKMHIVQNNLEITYSDDGKGFNYEEKINSKTIGLTSMHSRINFLKGTIEVNTAPGQGATFRISIPC